MSGALSRRRLLMGGAAAAAWPGVPVRASLPPAETLVNDVHSQLNPTRVARVLQPRSIEEIQAAVRAAKSAGRSLSIAGGRHAAGGQQFGVDTVLLDMTAMNGVLGLNGARGQVDVEAGIQWPALVDFLVTAQKGQARPWGIVQKQGVDTMSIGGAIAANVHGSGLGLRPFIADVESFTLVDADGAIRQCDRQTNAELFRLAIGGYGLFGVVARARLRLAPRRMLERTVALLDVDDLVPAVERRTAEGFAYGNFQFATDPRSDAFLRRGIFTCHGPASPRRPIAERRRDLSPETWKRLVYLAHVDKTRAFQLASVYALATSGRIYWSDTHQLTTYVTDYHAWLDWRLGARERATEVLIEFYVPRAALAPFLAGVREDFRGHGVDLIFGSIRFIEPDGESFLPWAREASACVVLNLHTVHSAGAIEQTTSTFRRLVDLAIRRGGRYYLTYHRWATRAQIDACYPEFAEFLRRKRAHDPTERFQSDWYRGYRAMFTDAL